MFARKILLGLGALIALGSVQPANALPLLAENAGVKVTDILTLFPDHKDPNLFYYAPNSSGVVFDETTKLPQIGFTYWGLSNGGPIDQAGAWLTFTMRLKSDASQREALESLIAEGKRVAVLPVQASTIGIATNAEGGAIASPLFKEFHFGEKAGFFESEVGVNAVMTGIGAKVFRKAIDNPQLIKTDYCYKVTGLGPNMEGKITVKWKNVYDHFAASASVGGFWSRGSIAVEIEKLVQRGDVVMELNGGDASEWDKMQKLTTTIVDRLFRSTLEMKPGSAPKGGGWSFSSYSLSITHKEELKTEVWTLTKRDLVDREYCASMRLADLSPYKKQFVQDADAE